jgi:hypothetical protein
MVLGVHPTDPLGVLVLLLRALGARACSRPRASGEFGRFTGSAAELTEIKSEIVSARRSVFIVRLKAITDFELELPIPHHHRSVDMYTSMCGDYFVSDLDRDFAHADQRGYTFMCSRHGPRIGPQKPEIHARRPESDETHHRVEQTSRG